MKKFKKIFLIFLLSGFLFLVFGGFILAQKPEVDYPQVPGGATAPTSVKTSLPKYIQYLFSLSIVIAGLVAFASLVYGGFRYLTSAGSPIAMSEAKDQITAGILGLAILLASFLILSTINPQILSLKITPDQFKKGVILYRLPDCRGGETPTLPDDSPAEEGKDFLRVRRSLSSFDEFNGKTQSIKMLNPGDEMEVYLYQNEGFKPEDSPLFASQNHFEGACEPVNGGSSITLFWKMPGVYLFEKTDYESPPEAHLITSDFGVFGSFDNKIKSIKIMSLKKSFCDIGIDSTRGPVCKAATDCASHPECIGPPMEVAKFGAILHENENFEGDCQVFLDNYPNLANTPCVTTGIGPFCVPDQNVKDKASAITLFNQRLYDVPTGDGVTLYANFDFNEEESPGDPLIQCGPFKDDPNPKWIDASSGGDCASILGNNPKGSSIRVDGSYIALLFREDGRCEVFKPPGDLKLNDGNHVGDDKARYLLVIPVAKD